MLLARAPAKINLTLHVLRRRGDGFHDLESLVAFAGVSDGLALDPSRPLGLTVDGPTAVQSGEPDDNLVLRAARALAERVPGLRTGAFRLVKRLPVGAGIGGGSSDAAAGLRLLARLNGLAPDDERLHQAARATGSDVPVCITPRARVMEGTGDRVGPPLGLRGLPVVLANPGIHVPTPAVFAAMGLERGEERQSCMHPPIAGAAASIETVMAALMAGRNDMEAAALAIAPEIGDAVDALSATHGARLVRMSGSGSTCFALYGSRTEARLAAARLRDARPDWWVRATMLA